MTSDNIMGYMYSYIITPSGRLEELTSENQDKYMNQKVKIRFVTKCKHKDPTTFCHHCAGNFFYRRSNNQPVNIGTSMAQIASSLKNRSMRAFHNSVVTTSMVVPSKMFSLE